MKSKSHRNNPAMSYNATYHVRGTARSSMRVLLLLALFLDRFCFTSGAHKIASPSSNNREVVGCRPTAPPNVVNLKQRLPLSMLFQYLLCLQYVTQIDVWSGLYLQHDCRQRGNLAINVKDGGFLTSIGICIKKEAQLGEERMPGLTSTEIRLKYTRTFQ